MWQLYDNISDDEFKKCYNIDHVRPIATFNLSDSKNQYYAFHLTNCASLLKSKNYTKGVKRNL